MTKEEEKLFTEYKQVSALLAMEIDIMHQIAIETPADAVDAFNMLKAMKDEITTDTVSRESRYQAGQMLFNLGGAK